MWPRRALPGLQWGRGAQALASEEVAGAEAAPRRLNCLESKRLGLRTQGEGKRRNGRGTSASSSASPAARAPARPRSQRVALGTSPQPGLRGLPRSEWSECPARPARQTQTRAESRPVWQLECEGTRSALRPKRHPPRGARGHGKERGALHAPCRAPWCCCFLPRQPGGMKGPPGLSRGPRWPVTAPKVMIGVNQGGPSAKACTAPAGSPDLRPFPGPPSHPSPDFRHPVVPEK